MKAMGFECVKPEGAFYMLVKAPTGDDAEFSAEAKKLYKELKMGRGCFYV